MKDKLLKYYRESAFVHRLEGFAKRFRISKKHNISLYDAVICIYKELNKNFIVNESKAVAFNFTLATFPAIIFLFTLIPYIPAIDEESVSVFMEEYIPPNMYEAVESTIEDIISRKNNSWQLFGFLTATFLATNGMVSLMDAFNRCYSTKDKRSVIQKYLTAAGLTFLLAFVLVSAVIILVFGGPILQTLVSFGVMSQEVYDFFMAIQTLQYVGFVFLFFFAISFIYYFAPSVHKRWKFSSYGTMIATALCLLLSYLFSFYITNFGTYNKLYGSIGTLIGFMVWLQGISLILLFGFEINAGIDMARRKQSGEIFE